MEYVYDELSYKVVGSLFDVYKKLGSGHPEKAYGSALLQDFGEKEIEFKQGGAGKYCPDFLIDEKFVLGFKVKPSFSKRDVSQMNRYLKLKKLKLGVLAVFWKSGVKFTRVLNID